MNSACIETLSNPRPCAHIVYSYADEAQLAEAVCLFASTGLRKVEAVLLILSDAHYDPVRARLRRQGFNLGELETTGHLICENAKDLLDTFMLDGIIDEHKFKTRVGGMIEKAKGHGNNNGKDRPVRIFGEIVDLLWMSNFNATQRLEELWSEVIEKHSVPLLCAYSLAGSRSNTLPQPLLSCHSHALAY